MCMMNSNTQKHNQYNCSHGAGLARVFGARYAKRSSQLISGLALALILMTVFNLSAATTNLVKIGDSGVHSFFNPTNLTINVGDTIKWTNTVTTTHDTTHNPPT